MIMNTTEDVVQSSEVQGKEKAEKGLALHHYFA